MLIGVVAKRDYPHSGGRSSLVNLVFQLLAVWLNPRVRLAQENPKLLPRFEEIKSKQGGVRMDKKENQSKLLVARSDTIMQPWCHYPPHGSSSLGWQFDQGQSGTNPARTEQWWFRNRRSRRSVFARAVSGGAETVPAALILMLIAAVGSLYRGDQRYIGRKFDSFLISYKAFQSFPSIIWSLPSSVSWASVSSKPSSLSVAWTKYAYLMRSMTMQLKNEPISSPRKCMAIVLDDSEKNYFPVFFTRFWQPWALILAPLSPSLALCRVGGSGTIAWVGEPWSMTANFTSNGCGLPCLCWLTILLFTKFGDALGQQYNRMEWSKSTSYSPLSLGTAIIKKYEYRKWFQQNEKTPFY